MAASPTPGGEDQVVAAVTVEVPASKKKKTKAKKAFVPLPSLEQVQEQLPWHIAFSQKLGRHAIASRDIQLGESVLTEDVVAGVPVLDHQEDTCHSCFQALPSSQGQSQPPSRIVENPSEVVVNKQSGGYKRYCSKTCSDRDTLANLTAPVHAAIPQLAQQTECDPTLLRMILELDARNQQHSKESQAGDQSSGALESNSAGVSKLSLSHEAPGEAAAQHQANNVAQQHEEASTITCSIQDVNALLSPWERNEHAWRQALTAGCQALHKAITAAATYQPSSQEQLQSLASCVNANAHATGHQTDTNSNTALGMYPVLSMFNHSCNPNLAHSSRGSVQHVHATREIKKGQQLCVHYTELFEPRVVRQQALMQEKFFSCACERCSVPLEQSSDRFLEGILCGKGQCREVLVTDKPGGGQEVVFKCVGCGRTTPGRAVDGTGPRDIEQQATKLWNHALLTLGQKGSDAAKPYFQLLQDQCQGPGKLHPMHVRIMDTHMPLVNSCRRAKDIQGAVRNLTALISAMETHHASPLVEISNLYQHLAHLYIDLAADAQPNKKLVARAQKLARDTHRKKTSSQRICKGQDAVDDTAAFMHELDLVASGGVVT